MGGPELQDRRRYWRGLQSNERDGHQLPRGFSGADDGSSTRLDHAFREQREMVEPGTHQCKLQHSSSFMHDPLQNGRWCSSTYASWNADGRTTNGYWARWPTRLLASRPLLWSHQRDYWDFCPTLHLLLPG